MSSIRPEVARLAPLETPILLLGETGVGKGVAARQIHAASPRRSAPFVHVDCGSLVSGLFESELFGHERGAFTGAQLRHVGRFERAARGTLFLDEIGELVPSLQAKLLHVLQDRSFERVGGDAPRRFEARVLVATHRDLAHEVRCGRFRADLYFRISVARITIPPLRERRFEIARLVCEGFDRIKQRLSLPLPLLGSQALTRLERDPWPGNVRQLFNVLERLTISHPGRAVGESEVEAALDEGLGGELAGRCEVSTDRVQEASLPDEADERKRIVSVLEAVGGNVSGAARRLGVPRTTLRRRLLTLGLARVPSSGAQESQRRDPKSRSDYPA